MSYRFFRLSLYKSVSYKYKMEERKKRDVSYKLIEHVYIFHILSCFQYKITRSFSEVDKWRKNYKTFCMYIVIKNSLKSQIYFRFYETIWKIKFYIKGKYMYVSA